MKTFTDFAVFDFDGTLVDSMPTWSEKMLRLLRMQNITPPEGLVITLATLGDSGSLDYFEKHFALTMTREQMLKEMDSFALPRYANEIPLKEGVKQYLQDLKEQGVKIALLTASPHKMFEPALKRLEIYSLFDCLYSSDDFGLSKSNPQIYIELAKKLNASCEQITFFDDNINAITTAKTAGLNTVGVYDLTSEKDKPIMQKTADFYINSFKDLVND